MMVDPAERNRFSRFSSLRRNVAANLAGRAWVTLLGVAFIPLYVRFLGMEAYGLVGFFATLQGILGILDLGLGASVNRELARLSATGDRRREQQSTLRTLELCYWAITATASCVVFLLAPVIAEHWVQPAQLSTTTVARSVRLMGVVLALQLPLAFYQAALMGLQRQVALNAILVAGASVRSVVTALVLWRVAPTIEAFLLCQGAVSLVQTALSASAVWAVLGGVLRARPDRARLAAIRGYAAATSANSVVGIALTQLDKVLLSRLLPLEHFGYYALAGTLASFVWAIAIPINQALFPRFAQLVELRDRSALTALYHRASQFMALALVPAAATLIAFSWHVMWLWTHSTATADRTALLASLLIAGTMINGLISVPGYLQSAAGWPQLMMYTNAAAALLLVPAILVIVPRYGAPGAAFVWLALNIGYLVFNLPAMHRRLLRGELWRWYRDAVAGPAASAGAVALVGRAAMPADASMLLAAAWIAAVGMLAFWACAVVSPRIRPVLFRRPAPAAALIDG